MLSPICWGHSGGWNTCSPLSVLSRSGTSAAKHGVARRTKPAQVLSAAHGACSLAPSTPPHQACSYTKHPDASPFLYLLMTCCVGEIRNEDTWVLVVCLCVCVCVFSVRLYLRVEHERCTSMTNNLSGITIPRCNIRTSRM